MNDEEIIKNTIGMLDQAKTDLKAVLKGKKPSIQYILKAQEMIRESEENIKILMGE